MYINSKNIKMKIKRRKLHCFLNCFLFIQRGGQKVSKVAIGLLAIGWTFAFVSLFVAVAQKISWLDYLYYFSYIKLGVTLVKYIPQVQLSHLPPPNAYYLLTLISFQTWLEKCRPNTSLFQWNPKGRCLSDVNHENQTWLYVSLAPMSEYSHVWK